MGDVKSSDVGVNVLLIKNELIICLKVRYSVMDLSCTDKIINQEFLQNMDETCSLVSMIMHTFVIRQTNTWSEKQLSEYCIILFMYFFKMIISFIWIRYSHTSRCFNEATKKFVREENIYYNFLRLITHLRYIIKDRVVMRFFFL